MSVAALVNINEWPLSDFQTTTQLRETFQRDGVVVLPNFILPDVVLRMVAETEELIALAHRSESHKTAYLSTPDDSFPVGHPRRTVQSSAVEVVAYDHVPAHHAVRELYESDELMTFVAGVLGQEKLYRYADPFGALNLAVMAEGDQLGWHFDMTDFVVSLALQPSQAGGEFENAQKLRTSTDENYDDVQSVLSGNADDRVRVEPMHAGTLMIFNGRTSLHKVTPVEGSTLRIVALLAYDTKSGTDSSDELKLSRYGRLPQ
jgi:hypothetical protein